MTQKSLAIVIDHGVGRARRRGLQPREKPEEVPRAGAAAEPSGRACRTAATPATGTEAMPLQKIELTPGNGAEIKSGQTALVHYTGWLYDAATPENKGKTVRQLGGSRTLRISARRRHVITGWDQGVVGMKLGRQAPPRHSAGHGLRRARRGRRTDSAGARRWCSTSSWSRFVDACAVGGARARCCTVRRRGQAATLIHAGRVIDGVSDTVKTNQTVVVDAGKIVAIEAWFSRAGRR